MPVFRQPADRASTSDRSGPEQAWSRTVDSTVSRPRTVAGPTVGAQFHGMWSSYTDHQRIEVLDTLRDAGIRTVRLDVSWAMLQPSDAMTYDPWGVGFVDRVIALCQARGISPLITFWLTPGWANGNRGERVLPSDPADYARAAHWAARRYAGRVLGWEIWNEPNVSTFWYPRPDPEG